MASPIRLTLLMLLADEELSVSTIAARQGISCSSASQHLAKLRMQRLVTIRKERQTVYYSSRSRAAAALLRTLDAIVFD
ncbi:winged helix-turn-helix transcriptional regulator [Rhizobium lusitanum]|nr:winged helix-turn-helix transcriptional regulator [Rhizobium lusitanum]